MNIPKKDPAARSQADVLNHQYGRMKTLLVARDSDGRELARRVCDSEQQAERLMIAFNRPPSGCGTFPVWGIETIVESETNEDSNKG